MDDFQTGLIFVVALAALSLFRFVIGRIGPGAAQETEPDEPPPAAPEEGPIFRPVSVRTLTDTGHSKHSGGSHDRPEIPARRYSRRALLNNRQAVQNAFVTAEILGPCRAHQPYEIR